MDVDEPEAGGSDEAAAEAGGSGGGGGSPEELDAELAALDFARLSADHRGAQNAAAREALERWGSGGVCGGEQRGRRQVWEASGRGGGRRATGARRAQRQGKHWRGEAWGLKRAPRAVGEQ